jgi:hypothetical protein
MVESPDAIGALVSNATAGESLQLCANCDRGET